MENTPVQGVGLKEESDVDFRGKWRKGISEGQGKNQEWQQKKLSRKCFKKEQGCQWNHMLLRSSERCTLALATGSVWGDGKTSPRDRRRAAVGGGMNGGGVGRQEEDTYGTGKGRERQ